MKTVFYEVNAEEETVLKRLIANANSDAQYVFVSDIILPENIALAHDAETISVFINSPVTKAVIDQLPNLKLITTRSTGFDHVDVKYAKSKGITVCNVPSYGSRTVAEYTFALILGLSRRSFEAYAQIKNKHDFDFSNFKGFDLIGKTLGVIGTGRIGMNVIEIATKGFGMKVVAYDPFPNTQKAEELKYSYMKLEELLPKADIVTMHVPYNDQTHHLINKSNIKLFKPGSLLINTARGEVIDTEAIMEGLNDSILSGVGLDVLEGERQLKEEWSKLKENKMDQDQIKTLLEDHMLIDSPKVAITPHIAFFTEEARTEILQTTVDNIIGFENNTPKNSVK